MALDGVEAGRKCREILRAATLVGFRGVLAEARGVCHVERVPGGESFFRGQFGVRDGGAFICG